MLAVVAARQPLGGPFLLEEGLDVGADGSSRRSGVGEVEKVVLVPGLADTLEGQGVSSLREGVVLVGLDRDGDMADSDIPASLARGILVSFGASYSLWECRCRPRLSRTAAMGRIPKLLLIRSPNPKISRNAAHVSSSDSLVPWSSSDARADGS